MLLTYVPICFYIFTCTRYIYYRFVDFSHKEQLSEEFLKVRNSMKTSFIEGVFYLCESQKSDCITVYLLYSYSWILNTRYRFL